MLLDRKRVGLILRVFSPKPELIQKNVQLVLDTVEVALTLEVKSKQVFSRIDVLVSADSRYGDSDCGGTTEALRSVMAEGEYPNVHVSETKHGDIYCGMLNYGVALQSRYRIDYSMILSFGVKDYLVPENVEAMLGALESGALVTGLALKELAPSILEGRIANTCAIWHNESLLTVGGFDLRASKPLRDDRLAVYVRSWSPEKGEDFYNAAGVEEIIPLVRLVKTFGSCIAPVEPLGEGQHWIVSEDPDVQKREQSKLATKFARQMRWCVTEDVDFTFLQGGVMPAYRTF